MDVPLVLNDIGIRQGLMGYKEKSSTFCQTTDVVGLSALYKLNELSTINFFPILNDRKGRFVH